MPEGARILKVPQYCIHSTIAPIVSVRSLFCCHASPHSEVRSSAGDAADSMKSTKFGWYTLVHVWRFVYEVGSENPKSVTFSSVQDTGRERSATTDCSGSKRKNGKRLWVGGAGEIVQRKGESWCCCYSRARHQGSPTTQQQCKREGKGFNPYVH